MEGALQESRQSKPTIISESISRLARKIITLEVLIQELQGSPPRPIRGEPTTKESTAAVAFFQPTHDGITSTLNEFSDRLQKDIDQLREMLI